VPEAEEGERGGEDARGDAGADDLADGGAARGR
jgi:hypothetical protein